jgi:Leucine-rich repeat (LRR) protein|tara:strand:+ start:554 stop:856 length:303 start_codon:yes stop_codon:yes gene_type:complete
MVSGTLPPSLGQLTLMEKFYLPNNFISGTVPASLGNMLKLDELDFGENQLSGTIPTTLGELPRMLRMDFDFNHITHFPAEVRACAKGAEREREGGREREE